MLGTIIGDACTPASAVAGKTATKVAYVGECKARESRAVTYSDASAQCFVLIQRELCALLCRSRAGRVRPKLCSNGRKGRKGV